MKKFLPFVLLVGLFACNDNAKVEAKADSLGKEIDTLFKKAISSDTVDSVESKGGRLLDSLKSRGGVLLDSARAKSERIKIRNRNEGSTKDSVN